MKRFAIFSILAVLISATVNERAYSAEGNGSRAKSKWGATVGLGHEPLGSLVGFNLHYNIFNFLQVRAGYGTASTTSVDPATSVITTVTATSIGGGFKLFVPGWNLSPFAGIGYSKVSFIGTFELAGQSISATDGLNLTYAVGGFEWQMQFGFVLGLQVQYSLADIVVPGNPTPIELPPIPGIYLGWFF